MNSMRQRLVGTLARRLGWSVFFASIVIIAVSAGSYLYVGLQNNLDWVEARVHEIGDSHISSISERVWVKDIKSLSIDVNGMLEVEAVKYVEVNDGQGRILAKAGVKPKNNVVEYERPISYQLKDIKHELGTLTIAATTSNVYRQFLITAIDSILLFTIQISLIVGLILWLFNRNVTQHLRAISMFAERIELSNIDQFLVLDRRKKSTVDELDILLASLTGMQHKLNESVGALKDSEEYLSLTLDSIGDAVIATDKNGLVVRMNPIAEQLTGWASEEGVGRGINKVVPIVDAMTGKAIDNPIKKALATGEIISLSNGTTLISKQGHQYQIADSAAPIQNNQGEIIGGILVFHDVSDEYRIREHLRQTQKRLILHVEQTPLGVIEWDNNLTVTDWNPAAEKIFGYSKERAVGKHYKDLLASEKDAEGLEQRWDVFVDGSVANTYLLENIDQSGNSLHCEWYSTLLLDEDEKMIGVASLVLDVTERIDTQQALVQHRAEQEMLLSYMLDAVISTDSNGVIESLNASAEIMFGYKEEEITGKELRVLLPEEIWSEYDALINQPVTKRGRGTLAKIYEVQARKKNGQCFPMRFSIGVPPKLGNSKQKFIYSIHDLTGEREKEEQLRHSQKMDALGKLTGGLAHDYNNMLGVILGYTELLDMTVENSPTTTDYVSKIRESSERGVALTKKMLSLSRQQPTQAAKVDLNKVLIAQQQMLQKTLTARITVELELAPDLWDIWIDDGDLLDAIVNLSINAMHAISTTGKLTFITLNKTFNKDDSMPIGVGVGDHVVLQVRDTGVGMEKEVLARVFDPFYTTKSDGSGLGLSQVYGFMGRSEGAVQVESVIGEGTCFTLYFPRCVRPMENHKDELTVDDLQILEGTESILVVDDELDLLQVASELFTGYGYQVHTAISAAVALKILDERNIDFVLSDVVMPEADGYELAAIIQHKYPRIPIQLVSGYNERVSTLHFDKTLKENLISKPYSARTVLARIREVLDAEPA